MWVISKVMHLILLLSFSFHSFFGPILLSITSFCSLGLKKIGIQFCDAVQILVFEGHECT